MRFSMCVLTMVPLMPRSIAGALLGAIEAPTSYRSNTSRNRLSERKSATKPLTIFLNLTHQAPIPKSIRHIEHIQQTFASRNSFISSSFGAGSLRAPLQPDDQCWRHMAKKPETSNPGSEVLFLVTDPMPNCRKLKSLGW